MDHLFEVDVEIHDDLVSDTFTDSCAVTDFVALAEYTEKGKDLYYLYKMFSTDDLEKDGGLFSGDTLNGLCL